MRDEEIRRYAEIMRDCGISRLTVTEKGATVELERPQPAPQVIYTQPAMSAWGTAPAGALPMGNAPAGMLTAADAAEGAGNAAAPALSAEALHDYTSVNSPMVGMFYAAPAENADPFVSVGDRVEEGQTLCIIEAMKLMNEIRAEQSGVIEQVCVSNGQVVEYGTELFRIRA